MQISTARAGTFEVSEHVEGRKGIVSSFNPVLNLALRLREIRKSAN
jgi:hypothetical protein